MPHSAPHIRGLRYAAAALAALLMGAAFTLGNGVDYGMGNCDCQDGFFWTHTFGWPCATYERTEHHRHANKQSASIQIVDEAYYPFRTALNLLIAVAACMACGRVVLWATLRQFSLRALLGFVSAVGVVLVVVPAILEERIFWQLQLRGFPPWLSVPLFIGLLCAIYMLGKLVVRFIRRFASSGRSPSVAHG